MHCTLTRKSAKLPRVTRMYKMLSIGVRPNAGTILIRLLYADALAIHYFLIKVEPYILAYIVLGISLMGQNCLTRLTFFICFVFTCRVMHLDTLRDNNTHLDMLDACFGLAAISSSTPPNETAGSGSRKPPSSSVHTAPASALSVAHSAAADTGCFLPLPGVTGLAR